MKIELLTSVLIDKHFDEICETMDFLMDTKNIHKEVMKCNFGDTSIKWTFCCIEDNRVVGLASIFIDAKMGHQPNCYVGFIEDVVVHKDYRGRGFGKALVNQCINEAKKNSCYKCILSCSTDKIDYYKQLGFKKHEVTMRLDL